MKRDHTEVGDGASREVARKVSEDLFRFGTVDPQYSNGRPKVKLDGEDEVGSIEHPRVSSYTPSANDRVMMVRSGNQWVVLGKVL